MQDQHNNSLIDPMGECTQCLLNLVVIGRATPYLHNGEMQVEQEETGEVIKLPKGQLISNGFLVNENKSTCYIIVLYVEFFHPGFRRIQDTDKSF